MASVPERHLGLVQASENEDLDATIDRAADAIEEGVDLAALRQFEREPGTPGDAPPRWEPLGQRIAVARDVAFSFRYPHMLDDWRRAGAEIIWFSPLADETPDGACDAVFLPGGYPELHAGRLSAARAFRAGMADAARRGAVIYGECGGYMVLGEGMRDADGERHAMLGMLGVETDFSRRKLHLGYRDIEMRNGKLMGHGRSRGHEFHYASVTCERGERLFDVKDARGTVLPAAGLRAGAALGSFIHLVDVA